MRRFAAVLSLVICSTAAAGRCDSRPYRDPLVQPFSARSIWNMPIGRKAVYVPARIPLHRFFLPDNDIIIMTPDAPAREVWTNNIGWTHGDRCTESAYAGFSVPIPNDFIIPDERPSTPNAAAAILMPDRMTIVQFQPFARCIAGGPVTYLRGARYPDVDIYGRGTAGAHGGSGLSSIGGTIRLGELFPGRRIRHALKINLNGSTAISSAFGGYRWPARTQDSCAPACYGGKTPALRMGALLALPPAFKIDTLETEPARSVAWTLKNYGGYLVDNAAWSAYGLAIERGPAGSVYEEFARSWGYTMTGVPVNEWDGKLEPADGRTNTSTPWGRDMITIFSALHVIDNNSPTAVGGGGRRRQPLARSLPPT